MIGRGQNAARAEGQEKHSAILKLHLVLSQMPPKNTIYSWVSTIISRQPLHILFCGIRDLSDTG